MKREASCVLTQCRSYATLVSLLPALIRATGWKVVWCNKSGGECILVPTIAELMSHKIFTKCHRDGSKWSLDLARNLNMATSYSDNFEEIVGRGLATDEGNVNCFLLLP